MNNREIYKPYQIFFIVLLSCFLNVGGRALSESLHLPLWLDSFGTFLTAYILGPLCGVIAGVSGNILHGFMNPISFVYAITSVFIAVVVGIMARRGWLETLLKTMSLSVMVTVVCVFISVVLSITFYGGGIGNEWGDGIVEEFTALGVPRFICFILGQFYMDFLDKVITLVALFLCIKVYRFCKPYLPQCFRRYSILLLVILSSVCFTHQSYASSRSYNSFALTVYNKSNGLIGGKANDIASTNDGILWIGTYEGLYRHNGSEFRLMNEFESIKTVRCLYVDDEGRLFVGTNDSGLSIIINEEVLNVLEAKDGLPADSVRSIIRGADGLYYVGTADDLAILTIADGLGVVATVPEIRSAYSLSADTNDHIYAVSESGVLFVLQNRKVVWSSKNTNEKFTAVFFAPNGTLYASTESSKLISYVVSDDANSENSQNPNVKLTKTGEYSCEMLRHINSIEQFDDTLFVCADNGAGFFVDGAFHNLETGAFNNSIDNMTEDYQGNLWFTSSRLGILKMCETPFTEIYASGELPISVVNSTAKFLGDLYFATDDGLVVFSGKIDRPKKNNLTQRLVGTRVRCLTTARDGSLWIATKQKGLLHAYPDGRIISFAEKYQFRTVTELSDGTIAAGSRNGIIFIKDDSIVQRLGSEDGLENEFVLCISETTDGLILAGTNGSGLAVIEREKRHSNMDLAAYNDEMRKQTQQDIYRITHHIKRSDGLSSNIIMRTVNDFDGKKATDGVFVITSNGLCYIDFYDAKFSSPYSTWGFPDSEGSQFSSENNVCPIRILSNFPYSNNYDLIIRENNQIFVLSSAGIYVVNRNDLLSGEKLDYELLDLKKGLRGSITANSWNYIDESGNIYLSCDTGVCCLNLNSYDKTEHSYRMQVKSVYLDGKRRIVQKDIPFTIPAECASVEIASEIINYSLNTPLISLFFEGVDEKPVVMNQRELSSVIYTNLKSGEYKFHISVLDSKEQKIVEEAVYSFSKAFRIYDYWWFTFYTMAVAMLAIIWLTWFVTSTIQGRRIEKQKSEMEAIKKQVRMGNETIFAIANAVEARDKSTGKHSSRVAEYAVLIARELGFSEEEQIQIRRTGLLHDIGKIGVPDSILNKPARLTDEEYAVMKTHTVIGGEILKDFTLIPHVDEGAKFHHERYDGSGYPNGLRDESIPLNARIIGIADAFDAMTANRCYRKALDMDYVISELKRCSGTQFDPGLVDIMLDLIESGKLNVEQTVEDSMKENVQENNELK